VDFVETVVVAVVVVIGFVAVVGIVAGVALETAVAAASSGWPPAVVAGWSAAVEWYPARRCERKREGKNRVLRESVWRGEKKREGKKKKSCVYLSPRSSTPSIFSLYLDPLSIYLHIGKGRGLLGGQLPLGTLLLVLVLVLLLPQLLLLLKELLQNSK
jgi:hypothetical protein